MNGRGIFRSQMKQYVRIFLNKKGVDLKRFLHVASRRRDDAWESHPLPVSYLRQFPAQNVKFHSNFFFKNIASDDHIFADPAPGFSLSFPLSDLPSSSLSLPNE